MINECFDINQKSNYLFIKTIKIKNLKFVLSLKHENYFIN
jgi:hypothetical protein